MVDPGDDAAAPPAKPEPDDADTPIAPRPTTLLAALIIAAVVIYNLRLDAMNDGYDGSKVTYALVFGMLFILGVDLSRFWPGGRGK